ncbi:MAG: RecQ family ATP-dependent DNA helicase [Firmicutes bacterium]|nr:RecQ family ATP-dependent DNA helicase [Bacillota bacterium]
MAKSVVFIDAEVGVDSEKICDLGAVKEDGNTFHSPSIHDFLAFVSGAEFVCGHNIVHHDLKYIRTASGSEMNAAAIDTLYLSPLLFPKRPYHALLKDDKLQSDELNNPVNDCKKAENLFYDEVNAFLSLPSGIKLIYYTLLHSYPEFSGFFEYVHFRPGPADIANLIRTEFTGKICANADLTPLIRHYPRELAYALALVRVDDLYSITPPWLLRNFPRIENVIKYLRGTPCAEGCAYCRDVLDIHRALKQTFGFDSFRTYNGEPLQQRAAQAAVDGKSLLAVFPTGGGKSITFQLPALMAGRAFHGLTVVISPLQSLMKDQVDNLNRLGITEAVTVNGLLSPIERADALRRVRDGSAALLYISPEQLRSRSIEKALTSRNIARFVIDEAHCFSAWGQDFRVDYLYIGDFIRQLQKEKADKKPIPVSCFTATAKQKVIRDICDYFKKKLDLDLKIFASSATRENLHYVVLYKETNEEKYSALRNLIAQKDCPTIVYVSRVRQAKELAIKLTADGFPARPFYGKMEPNEKIANQEAFIRNEVRVIVATSAFGMGVDKKDVGLVIHYDISSSLEDYVQEAGRAGRDPSMQAECYVLYNDNDLDKHFILLNQTKLSISEIQQVWKAIKDMTKLRPRVCCSALEVARYAGWDDSTEDVETRVRTAISALENAGYVKRGRNMPQVFATSILAQNMEEAAFRIEQSVLFSDKQRTDAKRIIKSLISSRSIAKAGNDDAESRVDYLADILGLTKEEVISAVNLMRQDGMLADSQDMSAYIRATDTENKSAQILDRFSRLEAFLLSQLTDDGCEYNLKELNEEALQNGISTSSVKDLRTLMYYHTIKNYVRKAENSGAKTVKLVPTMEISKLTDKFQLRIALCRFILEELYTQAGERPASKKEEKPVMFSLVGLYNGYLSTPRIDLQGREVTLPDVEDALLYLSKIDAMKLEGGFLVLYNGMEIQRLVTDNRIRYKVEDYRFLDEFYKQKIRQIHIVGEYANLMVRDYNAALQYVQDYFQMDFRQFIAKYFSGGREKDIDRNITPHKYHQLFGELSDIQSKIINDADSRYIVVTAGPGSGKTRVLVHKLAALLLLEDVKDEQLLMLTFSRAAATEFKKRLVELIGNTAHYVEIKTFHSYCFDLLGKIGSLDGAQDVVRNAAERIRNGEVEQGKITKSVLVIDEAQDMDADEFDLVCALMQCNEDMRVIAVGDDDQNIYGFRGSDSRYLRALIEDYGAVKYEMTENYRSKASIVALSNAFVSTVHERMKSGGIEAVQKEEGTVCITRHYSRSMEQAIVNQILESRDFGKRCVLTNTNEEALRVLGLLQKSGVRSKLIQSMGGFRLYDLLEVRSFLQQIDASLQSSVIPDALWKNAKQKLYRDYAGSPCLEICRNLLRDFEETNSTKYRTDFEEFLKESNYEDFYDDEQEAVYVSTIHKSKGREFSAVYLMLSGNQCASEEEKRKLYVGMTRAKDALYIHCDTDLFTQFDLPGIMRIEDTNAYAPPEEISLQLTHRDVVLDYFKGRKALISKLRSGRPLSVSGEYLSADAGGRTVRVAKLSRSCRETLQKLLRSGYVPQSANIRFIVAWQGMNDTEETLVILPDIHLKRETPRK